MAEISTCCHHGVYILARAPISFNILALILMKLIQFLTVMMALKTV